MEKVSRQHLLRGQSLTAIKFSSQKSNEKIKRGERLNEKREEKEMDLSALF